MHGVLTLKENHTWKCEPGNKLIVLDRGTLSFEYPEDWTYDIHEGAIYVHDPMPELERCDLAVSLFPVRVPPGADFDLDTMLMASLEGREDFISRTEIGRVERADWKMAWLEERYVDREHNRPARFRVGLVHGPAVCLVSFNYWEKRAAVLEHTWDAVLRTLRFGVQVADPTVGPRIN